MKTILSTVILGVILMSLRAGTSPLLPKGGASPVTANCFCQASIDNLTGKTSPFGVFKDFTDEVNTSYGGWFQQSEENQADCKQLCKTAAEAVGRDGLVKAACAANVPTWPPNYMATVGVFSRVGVRPFRLAVSFGDFIYKPTIMKSVCVCPAGWWSNTSNKLADVTTDGKCKKVGGHFSIAPFPPDGTLIGSWGATFGNELWVFGTPANGGAPFCFPSTLQVGECY